MKISENQFAVTSVVSIVGLLCIWVIPNTIALRHLLLVIGCLSAIGLIVYNWNQFKNINSRFFPLLCIFSLFIWVFIHYTLFSLNPRLELLEIKGLWMRSLLGAIAAVGLGIAIVKNSKLRLCFYTALFSTPLVNVLAYCWASYLNHGLLKPNEFVFSFLFSKIETAYFGAVAAAVAVGNLICLLVGKIDKSKIQQILGWLLGLILVLVSAVLSNTKNGVAIALALCTLLAGIVVVNSIFRKGVSKVLPVIVVTAIVLLSIGVWESHKSMAYRGWDTVFQDAALGVDIDNNKQWQKGEGTVPMPLNSLGVPAALNTYTRFAYAAVGMRLIEEYPMGFGSINRSFEELLNLAQIPHEYERQTHSGWIDFGLAFGIPGLILIFATLLSIIYFGLTRKCAVTLPWVMVCAAFIPFGLIAEITYKQYFEATIFFLSLASTTIIFDNKKNSRSSSND
jgi:hypothetical protein